MRDSKIEISKAQRSRAQRSSAEHSEAQHNVAKQLMPEKPLITWKLIADYLSIHPDTARRRLEKYVFRIGKQVAIYPSDLKQLAKEGSLELDSVEAD